MSRGWVGFDLDGTLAKYDGWEGEDHIGEPIPAMVDKLKEHLAKGDDVRIFTARVCSPTNWKARQYVQAWCNEHLGTVLPVTNKKDYGMIMLYDDRCVQVIPNTGVLVQDLIDEKGVKKCSVKHSRKKLTFSKVE